MINHYAVVGWRHLFRNKFYTAVSVFGLTLGLTAFMLISAYINRELSYENFHENKDSIYRIGLKRYKNGELIETSARTFPGVRFLLKENFPEISGVNAITDISLADLYSSEQVPTEQQNSKKQ